jgi:tRNA threonylcarbamoyl adenosine modification protein YjeE
MTCAISTTSSEATQAVARRLGKLLHGGELIELSSDLGGGKTTFTQGLAQGLGYDGEVTSPTFTLSQIYRVSDDLELHHYDLYRLGETGVVGDELAEDLTDPHLVTVIIIFSGPGSFTSLRIGHAVVNALADSLGFPVVGARGDDWQEQGLSLVTSAKPGRPALPFYGADAHITRPKS